MYQLLIISLALSTLFVSNAYADSAPQWIDQDDNVITSITVNIPERRVVSVNRLETDMLFRAKDPDKDSLNYEITKDDDDHFILFGRDIWIAEYLDYEATKSYNLVVKATDTTGKSASINITINVINQNDSPEFLLDCAQCDYDYSFETDSLDIPEGTVIGVIRATDVDILSANGDANPETESKDALTFTFINPRSYPNLEIHHTSDTTAEIRAKGTKKYRRAFFPSVQVSDGEFFSAATVVITSRSTTEPNSPTTSGGDTGSGGGGSGSGTAGGGGSGSGTAGGGGSGSGTGGGSGGSSARQDQHGNTVRTATRLTWDEESMSSSSGQIHRAGDVDYFRFSIPHAGKIIVETTGRSFTTGRMWQDSEEIGEMESLGRNGRNFKISSRAEAGEVIVAVEGDRGRRGAYSLKARLLIGYLENPGDDSKMSGIGVLSGWICHANVVELEIDGEIQKAGYGTSRADTVPVCGDSNNGFGLLYNWNHLIDGEEHIVRVLADGEEFDSATFEITTLGEEFLRGVKGEATVSDFPSPGEKVRLVWQESLQNFMIAPEEDVKVNPKNLMNTYDGQGVLENPGHGSYQSGVSVISGWVCDTEQVEIEIDGELQPAAYGTEREDTSGENVCGDSDNGFSLLYNWNHLTDGEHMVRVLADGEEFGRATFEVTTLQEEFVRGVEGTTTVMDFPTQGKETTLEWQQSTQNFVITGVKETTKADE